MLAAAALVLFVALGVRGTGADRPRPERFFCSFFWGVAAVWVISMLPHMQLDRLAAPAPAPLGGFLPCVALVWWCFAGFETCCAMGARCATRRSSCPGPCFWRRFWCLR